MALWGGRLHSVLCAASWSAWSQSVWWTSSPLSMPWGHDCPGLCAAQWVQGWHGVLCGLVTSCMCSVLGALQQWCFVCICNFHANRQWAHAYGTGRVCIGCLWTVAALYSVHCVVHICERCWCEAGSGVSSLVMVRAAWLLSWRLIWLSTVWDQQRCNQIIPRTGLIRAVITFMTHLFLTMQLPNNNYFLAFFESKLHLFDTALRTSWFVVDRPWIVSRCISAGPVPLSVPDVCGVPGLLWPLLQLWMTHQLDWTRTVHFTKENLK